MKKINKFLIILSIILISFYLISCKNNNGNEYKYQFEYNEDFIIDLDDETKEDIRVAYDEKYGSGQFFWLNPNESNSEFSSDNDVVDYAKSFNGFRVYSKIGDNYILVRFGAPWSFGTYYDYDLYYKDTLLIEGRGCEFGSFLGGIYIYNNGEISEVLSKESTESKDIFDLSEFDFITLEDALKIKENHDSFNHYYFSKFLNEEELKTNDYNAAYFRIRAELKKNNNPTTTTSHDQDTEITISHS